MIYTGLVSVTFRKLSPEEIVSLVSKAGLDGIEWGGDIHVPHGDLKRAEEVFRMTSDAGLKVASYGSYYYMGESNNVPFESIIETALALRAPNIRVWAGKRGSADADEKYREALANEAREAAAAAEKAGISVSFEYHRNTLTDTSESAVRLLKDISHQNIYTYWQPPVDSAKEECMEGLWQVLPWLSNIHAYKWVSLERMPLSEGMNEWSDYLGIAREAKGDRFCLLEFVKDDSPEQFLQDAQVLKKIVSTSVLQYPKA